MDRLKALVALAARLLLAQIFLVEGWGKIAGYADVQQYMIAHGVRGELLPLVIATELGFGLCIAAGVLTRLAALVLAGFCVLTALIFHADFGDPDQLVNFQKNAAMAGGFLALLALGPGAVSVDAWLERRKGAR
ncbi:DoxX family protein [Labrys wisconsinensis]|uniref:Oxidoreductase n=1 Tax=Labrys wisconsinensis TaxID=425677 RepID=A0ABU0IZZ4_9HYPH|nr:DoxX family protein [Labrys wisconsinensis]MDQ0467590.1 putative oxidoreductase [Labrys wisconsinensis]